MNTWAKLKKKIKKKELSCDTVPLKTAKKAILNCNNISQYYRLYCFWSFIFIYIYIYIYIYGERDFNLTSDVKILWLIQWRITGGWQEGLTVMFRLFWHETHQVTNRTQQLIGQKLPYAQRTNCWNSKMKKEAITLYFAESNYASKYIIHVKRLETELQKYTYSCENTGSSWWCWETQSR